MKFTNLKLFLSAILMAFCFAGQAQENAAWEIKLTEADGLLGENINGQYCYKSSLFQLPEAETSIRFTVIETESNMNINGFPFTAIAEFTVRDASGNVIPYSATTNADQNELTGHIDGGGLPALSDGNNNTFFHSIWSEQDVSPMDYHYLEFAFLEPVEELSLEIVWRLGGDGERLRATLAYLTPGNSEWSGDFEEETVTAGDVIDLGLPSGTKWASCNVGATKPEEYGDYYAWGETNEKESYGWGNYKWSNGYYGYETIYKYCTSHVYGTVDNKVVLELEDDVAHVKWGGDWRMPTKGELDELRDNCIWSWTKLNGVNGYKVIGPNGNSIFLPAAGSYPSFYWSIMSTGNQGFYWSSTVNDIDATACNLKFYDYGLNNEFNWDYDARSSGGSVRPVIAGDYTPGGNEERGDEIEMDALAWGFRLTAADGLSGEDIGIQQYCYKSSLFELPEPTASICFTVVKTFCNKSVNGYPFTSIAEFVIRDASGNEIPYTASTNSDECSVSGESGDNGQGLVALSDDDYSTYYHSIWRASDAAPDEYHYLEFAFAEPVSEFSIDIVWRAGYNGKINRATVAYLTPYSSWWNDEEETPDGGDTSGEVNVTEGDIIDLGLPSGTKWASCNLGATAPEDFGSFYCWSGTDIANEQLGGNWYMPTKDDGQELIDNSTWQWCSINDVPGYKVTGPNGNSIFLPATGWITPDATTSERVGEEGYYWTITPAEDYLAYGLQFDKNELIYMSGLVERYQVIRPVYRDAATAVEYISIEKSEENTIYDVRGCELKKITAPGVYIVNGKKVVVKK